MTKNFYANGTSIVLSDYKSDEEVIGVTITYIGQDGQSTSISITKNDIIYDTDNKSVSAVAINIFGGSKNANVESSHITVNGGLLTKVYGGGYGTSESNTAHVKDVSINVTDGIFKETLTDSYDSGIVGGGLVYSTVETVNLTMSGGSTQFLIGGGIHSITSSSAGSKDELYNSVSNKTTITVSGNAKIDYLFGGAQSYGKVNESVINFEGGETKELIGSGSNGTTLKTTINISGGNVTNYAFTVNRGAVAQSAAINVTGGTVAALYAGAAQESEKTTGTITGTTSLSVTEGIVTKTYLGLGLNDANVIIDIGNNTIYAQGGADGTTNLFKDYTIATNKTWILTSGTLEIKEGSSITNNGTIIVSDLSGLTSAAAIGGNIQLAADIEIQDMPGALEIAGGTDEHPTVLDIHGHKITIKLIGKSGTDIKDQETYNGGASKNLKPNANRIVIADGATVTIKSSLGTGMIEYTENADATGTYEVKSPIKVGSTNSSTTLILDNVKIESTEYGVGVFKNGNLTVSGGSIVAGASAISGNGLESDCMIALEGGNYESTSSAAIYFPSTATLTINDATINGKTGVEVRAGNVTITKSTITADGQTSTAKTEGDGPIAWGMGIAVIDHPSYGKNADGSYSDISVTISGTKVTSNSYDLYVGDLNKNEANTFGGIEGKYVQYHNISISINGKTISSESSEDKNVKDRSYFTSDISSGSSSGGGIPITPPPVVPEPEPIVPDTNGNVTVPALDEKKTEELIHEAVSSGSDSITIIDTSNVKGDYTAVTVSKSDLETIAKSIENNKNIDSVSIPTSEGDIIIEKEVLSSILENTNADSVSFEVEDAKNKLTEEQKKAVGDRPVYDINIKAGNENVTSFNGKTITISLPYTLKAGEDAKNIVVYYVKDDGSLEKVNCTYKDGKVTFETNHLSKYVIGYEESDKPVTPDTPDDNKKESSNTIYYAVAAVIIILIIIASAYYFMKKKQ